MVTVGGIIGGGMRLVRERPLAVLTWGIIYIVGTLAAFAAVFAPLMAMVMQNVGQSTPPDPSTIASLIRTILLLNFAVLILLTIISTAAFRAVLRPDEQSFGSIRLGMDELRIFALVLLFSIAMFVITFVMSLVMGLVMAATGGAMMGAGADGARGGFNLTSLLILIGVYGPPAFLFVRLAPAFALTIIRERIVIGEAWRLTSGNFWVMFAAYLVLGLILFVIEIVAIVAVVAPLMAVGGGPLGTFVALSQGQIAGSMMAIIGFGCLLFAVIGGVSIAFGAGSVAAATQGLLGTTDEDYAETFA